MVLQIPRIYKLQGFTNSKDSQIAKHLASAANPRRTDTVETTVNEVVDLRLSSPAHRVSINL